MRREYDFSILSQFKYPNLVAEFMETGYSICTLSEHMGHGRCKEDNNLIRDKLFWKSKITAEEAFRLSQLFSCGLEYLFSSELKMFGDKPLAYIRHYKSNQSQERDLKVMKLSDEIRCTLKEKPYLIDFMQEALSWDKHQIQQAIKLLKQMKVAN